MTIPHRRPIEAKHCSMVLVFFLSVFCLLTGPAFAHRVTVFAWVEGDMVHTESKFSGGRTVKEGRITVLDPEGDRLLEGRTDANGAFSFRAPVDTGMRILLQAGMGHQAEWMLTEEEVKGSDGAQVENKATESTQAEQLEEGSTERGHLGAIRREEIQHVVEEAVDRKLMPIMKLLAESEARASFRDVLGGIGYILGLVGIAAYVHARKSRGETPNHDQ